MNSPFPRSTRTNRITTASPSIIDETTTIISYILPTTTSISTTTSSSTVSATSNSRTITSATVNNNNRTTTLKTSIRTNEPKRSTTKTKSNKNTNIARNISTEKITGTGKLLQFLTKKRVEDSSTTRRSNRSIQTSQTTTTTNQPLTTTMHNNSKQQVLNKQKQQQQQQQSSLKEQQVPPKIDTTKVVTTKTQNDDNDRIHIVFSTGCSESQDWQSYLFFYSLWKSGQRGNVTRIVSGCTKQQQQQMERDFQTSILDSIPTASDRFFIYFTPDYSNIHLSYRPNDRVKNYKFFNKPFALQHWMENQLGYNHTTQQLDVRRSMDNTVIIILDPDQLILKPLVVDYTDDLTMKWHGQGQKWYLGQINKKRRWRRTTAPLMKIRRGRPFSQLYGLGTSWVSKIVPSVNATLMEITGGIKPPNIRPNPFYPKINVTIPNSRWTIKNKLFYTNRTNGLRNISEDEFYNYYNAGPPYIGIASDMYDIVTVWSDLVVPVYFETNRAHLAEMFAYSIASAYLGLRHQLAVSYMVSHPQVSPILEKWDNDTNILRNDTYFMEWSDPTYHYTNNIATERGYFVPYLFHYCQEYSLGPYNFFKYFIPKTILSCNHPMLLEPPSLLYVPDPNNKKNVISTNSDRSECGLIAFQYNKSFSMLNKGHQNVTNLLHKKHSAYALCQIIYRFNDAIEFWKHNHCGSNANYEKIWTISPLTTAATIVDVAKQKEALPSKTIQFSKS